MLKKRWFSIGKSGSRIAAGLIAGAVCITSVPGISLQAQETGIEALADEAEEDAIYLSDSRQWLWAYAGLDSKKSEMYGDAAKVPEGAKQPQLNRRYENSASWSRTTDINLSYDALEGITSWDQIAASEHVKKADKGIGTSACSEIVYELQPEDKRFCATIGYDASVLTNGQRPSSVEMKVLGSKTTDSEAEYEELYSSGVRYSLANDADRPYFVPQDVDVSVEGYRFLKLWVWDAGGSTNNAANNNPSDAVNWAWARILTKELTAEEKLAKAIAEADKLDEEAYMADSWAKFQTVLQEVKEASGSSDEAINEAVAKLEAAIAKLVKKADKTALAALIEKVESRDFTGFDAELKATFESALNQAKDVLADETLSEQDNARVKAAEDALSAAYAALLDTIKEPEGEEFDWISTLSPSYVKVGYGSLGIDKTVNNSGALTLGGVTYDRGLGAHAPAEIVYNLDGKYQFFHAVVGIDDSRVTNTNLGTVQFQVFLNEDASPVFESSRMGMNAEPETVNLPLSDSDSKLRIVILTPDDKNTNDWTDVADAKLYLNENGKNHAEQNILRFELEEQANRTVIDSEQKTITIKVPHGTDLSNLHISALETNSRTLATIQGKEAAVGDVIDAKDKDVTIRVENRAGEATEWIVKVIEKDQKAILDSDNQILKDNFYWATHKVDQFVMTGQSGPINRASDREGTGPVEYLPSYWAGYYDRTAFYGRDFCHQATGGQLGGLRDENFSMFKIFAQGATEARKYYTLWAYNFDGSPYLIDYRSDTNFVREVPAQFELVQRAYEQYKWTGDERYIYDEDLFQFYTNVMTKYIELHDDQNPNGVAEGYGGIWAGSCTYNERGEHPIEAGDAIGAQYQATLAYAGILEARGEADEAESWYQKAQDLKDYFNNEWSVNAEDPMGNYARVITDTGEKLYDFGKENSWFMPMKLITEPGERNDNYLDFISSQLGNGIGDKNAPNAPKNIEAYTYIPDTYFPYDRNQEAWKWMRYIAGIKDNPHERPVQGTNGDYPEISFTFVAQTIEGIMGIEADAGRHAVATASHLVTEGTDEEKMGYVDIKDIRMGTHMLDVRHDGRTKTTLQNHSEDSLTWEARFYGAYDYIKCGEKILVAKQKDINGKTVSYITVEVSPEEQIVVSIADDISADEKLDILKQEVERLEGELAKAEAEAAKKEAELAEAKKELQNAKSELEKAQAAQKAAEAEAEAAAAREAAAIIRAEAAEAEVSLLTAEAEALRTQAGELTDLNQQLALEKDAAQKEAEAAKKEAEAQKAKAEAAEESAKEAAARAEADVLKAQAEKKQAEEEAKKAQSETKRAEEALKKAEEEKQEAWKEAEKQKAQTVLNKGDSVFVNKMLYTVLDPKKKTAVAQGTVSRTLKSVKIPDTVTVKGVTCKVTEIAAEAFAENKKLTSVTIGKNVTKIGSQAFCKSGNLKTVTIKSTGLKSVGSKAFTGISKKAVIKVPKSKKKTYKKLLKNKVIKTAKIK